MDIRAIVMGFAFALMWSSAFTSARIIVLQAPALTVSSLRFLISGLLAVGIAYLLGQRIKLDRRNWRAVFIFGICQNALYLGLFFLAMQRIEASLASIIASVMPLLVGLASAVFLKERLSKLGVIGLAVGFAGVAIIMIARLQGGMDMLGIFYCLVGVVSLAAATLSVRSASAKGNLLMVVGLQMLVGSAALLIPALLFEEQVINWTFTLSTALSYSIIVPGLMATVLWFLLVERIGATRASTYHFLNPFFGVGIASIVLGETLTLQDVIGVVVVMAGIFAVQFSRVKPS